MSPKKIAACAALAVIAAALVILGSNVAGLVPQVQAELSRTPTPTPLIGNVMTVTPAPGAERASSNLKVGSKGDAVVTLQQRLKELGYYDGEVDGQFGSGTRTALKAFQQQNGLTADGVLGTKTSAILYSDAAQPCQGTATATPAPTAEPTAKPTEAAEAAPAEQMLTAVADPTAKPAARSKSYIRADGLPLLVNASNPLPDDYENYDLVCMNDYCDASVVKIKYKETYAEREAVDALMVMLRAAQADGLKTWQISSAYRSVEAQQALFDKRVASYMKQDGMTRAKALKATRKYVADPGCSEHHVGTCFDITVPGKSFGSTKQSTWLAEHAWEYGFIQRYAKGKTAITGISNEAWHYRWVGLEHSTVMHNEDLCLEEYIEKYGLIVEDE